MTDAPTSPSERRPYKVRKGGLMRIADLTPQLVQRLRADGATVTPYVTGRAA